MHTLHRCYYTELGKTWNVVRMQMLSVFVPPTETCFIRVGFESALVEIELPAELAGDAVGIHALVDRCKATPAKRHGRWEIALLWDSLEPSERELIDSLASGRRIGKGITPLQTLPYVDGTGIPDWDEMARAADRRQSSTRAAARPTRTRRN